MDRIVEGERAIAAGDMARLTGLLREFPGFSSMWLCTAARRGKHQIVQSLLSHKPNLTETEDGWTALQWAAHGGHDEMVRVLLEFCVPIGHSEQVQSRKRSREEEPTAPISSHLSRKVVGTVSRGLRRTSLHMAAGGGHHKVVELLLPHCYKSTLNAVDFGNDTALSLAVLGGHLEVVQLLIAQKLSLAETAALKDHDKIVKFLLDPKNPIAVSDREMCQTMRGAVRCGHATAVNLFVRAKPELLSKKCFVVFLFESISSKLDCRMLLELLDECERVKGPDYVCKLLAKKRFQGGLTILHSVLRDCPSELLLFGLTKFEWQRQTSIDTVSGNTLLHDAARSSYFNSQVLEKVLAMDPTALQRTNNRNQTPFDVAASQTHSWAHNNAAVISRYVSLEDIMEHESFARERVPALLEEFVRPPLLFLELHRDVVGIVCDYLFSHFSHLLDKEYE